MLDFVRREILANNKPSFRSKQTKDFGQTYAKGVLLKLDLRLYLVTGVTSHTQELLLRKS